MITPPILVIEIISLFYLSKRREVINKNVSVLHTPFSVLEKE